jgi:hypothetical protein
MMLTTCERLNVECPDTSVQVTCCGGRGPVGIEHCRAGHGGGDGRLGGTGAAMESDADGHVLPDPRPDAEIDERAGVDVLIDAHIADLVVNRQRRCIAQRAGGRLEPNVEIEVAAFGPGLANLRRRLTGGREQQRGGHDGRCGLRVQSSSEHRRKHRSMRYHWPFTVEPAGGCGFFAK